MVAFGVWLAASSAGLGGRALGLPRGSLSWLTGSEVRSSQASVLAMTGSGVREPGRTRCLCGPRGPVRHGSCQPAPGSRTNGTCHSSRAAIAPRTPSCRACAGSQNARTSNELTETPPSESGENLVTQAPSQEKLPFSGIAGYRMIPDTACVRVSSVGSSHSRSEHFPHAVIRPLRRKVITGSAPPLRVTADRTSGRLASWPSREAGGSEPKINADGFFQPRQLAWVEPSAPVPQP